MIYLMAPLRTLYESGAFGLRVERDDSVGEQLLKLNSA